MSWETDAMLEKAFSGIGCHWGLGSELYPKCKKALITALKSGEDFDTGWWTVEKTFQSGNIVREGNKITCWATDTNAFEIEGTGSSSFIIEEGMKPKGVMALILKHLEYAGDATLWNALALSEVAGFVVHRNGMAVDDYLKDLSIERREYPPGEVFSKWGFQEEPPAPKDEELTSPAPEHRIPYDVQARIRRFANDPENDPLKQIDKDGNTFIEFKYGEDTWKIYKWRTCD